jgi:WD40 repeat protein
MVRSTCLRRNDNEAIVARVQFSADRKTVVTASNDWTVGVWDAATGRQQRVLQHQGWARGMALSPDGKWIASSSPDNTVRLWGKRQRIAISCVVSLVASW